jgi:aldehyde dehydrogenase (NAD+)
MTPETAAASVVEPTVGIEGKELESIFARQQAFAPSLRGTTAQQRVAKLEKLRQALLAHREEIQQAAAADFSKPPEEVELSEIFPVLHEIAHARRHLKKWMKPVRARATKAMLGTKAEIRCEPRGVCLIISPWNYPFNLTFGPLVSAIAAGNTAMIKPSELTPNASRVIRQIVEELFTEDEVAVFEGEADVAQRLLALPFNHIFFTGSPAVGKIVMRAAADHLSSVTLELGGKSPAIVEESADLDKAVRNLVWGKFTNKGQTCIAPDYVYVHESVREAFLQKLKDRIENVFGANEQAQQTCPHYCRIVNLRHFERVRALLEDAKQRGATVLTGGATTVDERFIAPTVLVDVAADSKIMEEEIFGPLLPVLSYTDLDSMLREIDARPKPLALYVFGKDKARIEKVLGNTSAGGSCVNHSIVHFLHGNLPFGGVNNSGIGNSHGFYGFKAFSHERAVLTERFSSTHMLFPPYTAKVRMLIRMTSKYFA